MGGKNEGKDNFLRKKKKPKPTTIPNWISVNNLVEFHLLSVCVCVSVCAEEVRCEMCCTFCGLSFSPNNYCEQ